jgi:hypothetical protein
MVKVRIIFDLNTYSLSICQQICANHSPLDPNIPFKFSIALIFPLSLIGRTLRQMFLLYLALLTNEYIRELKNLDTMRAHPLNISCWI